MKTRPDIPGWPEQPVASHRDGDEQYDRACLRAALDQVERLRTAQQSSIEYSIKLQRMIEAARRHEKPLPSPELHHHKMLTHLLDEIERLRAEKTSTHEVWNQLYWKLQGIGNDPYKGCFEQADALVAERDRLRALLHDAHELLRCVREDCSPWMEQQIDAALAADQTTVMQVGCETANGEIIVHPESEMCEVCRPPDNSAAGPTSS